MQNVRIIILIVLSSVSSGRIYSEVTIKTDIPYIKDNDPMHRLDIYIPPIQSVPANVLFHIHGGGWKIGDKNRMKDTGMFYASKGMLFITPNYRLTPKVRHPAHAEDLAAALSWTFDNADKFGGDKHSIFLSGHSAGAHLAALLATNVKYLRKYNIKPGRLAGVIPVDTASFNLMSDNNERMVKRLILQAFGPDENTLIEASPFYNINSKTGYPRFLILNTTGRKLAADAGRDFCKKLKDAGCDAEFIPVENHTHKEMASGMHDPSDPVGIAILNFMRKSALKRPEARNFST